MLYKFLLLNLLFLITTRVQATVVSFRELIHPSTKNKVIIFGDFHLNLESFVTGETCFKYENQNRDEKDSEKNINAESEKMIKEIRKMNERLYTSLKQSDQKHNKEEFGSLFIEIFPDFKNAGPGLHEGHPPLSQLANFCTSSSNTTINIVPSDMRNPKYFGYISSMYMNLATEEDIKIFDENMIRTLSQTREVESNYLRESVIKYYAEYIEKLEKVGSDLDDKNIKKPELFNKLKQYFETRTQILNNHNNKYAYQSIISHLSESKTYQEIKEFFEEEFLNSNLFLDAIFYHKIMTDQKLGHNRVSILIAGESHAINTYNNLLEAGYKLKAKLTYFKTPKNLEQFKEIVAKAPLKSILEVNKVLAKTVNLIKGNNRLDKPRR